MSTQTKEMAKLTAKKQIVRILIILVLGAIIVPAGSYAFDEYEGHQWVNNSVESAELRNTHHGRNDYFCGEVSGINGLNMRTPYVRFVANFIHVEIAPVTLDQQKAEAFKELWQRECT